MKSMHPRFLLLSATLATAAAFAQAPAAPAPAAPAPPLVQDAPTLEGRKNQKVEKIHVEDSAVSIDEIRYAGQTQSITVHPKDNMPEYEIQPNDLTHSRPADSREGLSRNTGPRVWNIFKF
jgi:hypothetical protein